MTGKSKSKIRVRFAPSPTGFLHVGGLRTALYNYLFARQNKGVFFLRIEDTDQSRYVPGAVEALLKTLEIVGLKPNEGPYFQSKRLDIYKKHADELVKNGHAYHCFCSVDRLDQLRKIQEINKQPTMYDGLCRSLTPAEIKKKLAAGEKHVIRMNMPKEGQTIFQDLIHGEIKFENKLIDDQVLVKSDGFPTYHLAHAVDDHLMETSHVIRGDEWLSSTPKHLQLFKAFGWPTPAYAHIPLLLNPDHSKLSKRQGDVAVEDYLKKGYLVEALINFIALLGWNPGTEKEIFSLDELTKEFSLAKVQKAGAVFNLEKLDWMNSEYIKKMPVKKLTELCLPYLKEAGLVGEQNFLEAIISLEQERLTKLSDLPKAVTFFFKMPDFPAKMLVWRKSDTATTLKRLEKLLTFYDTWKEKWNKDALEQGTMEMIKKENLDNGATLWPMRVTLSGLEKSPGPFEIAGILGQKETLMRLKSAIHKLKA